ncbi:MAG: bifunctional helix-turn-helix transcriptional regulator/GNAT family N-acetyltransferase [Actinobacteria bacterium]|nr:bifunctional helix-turn-helix transcriptional regulator/GNAT family N-acetyltransferase [Actinomycetota bacterium]
MPKSEDDFDRRVGDVRHFNRFWTRQIGVLREGYLESPFSLTEVRVLYELAHREETTASELGEELGLDAGYLSRILRGFEKDGLIHKRPSEADGRRRLLRFTERGREAFAPLDARSRSEIGAMLGGMSITGQERLVKAMRAIERLLSGRPDPVVPYLLRPHQPGDMGWVVHRHGVLYAREYGWDERFEALVAEIVAKFIQQYDPRLERCFIAERDGEIVGCVFLVRESEEIAKLRLLLVEPEARGLGIGSRLVEECIRFARQAGYLKITLWTNDVLNSALRIYEGMGFRLVHEEPHHSFGHDLVGQTWELML